MRSLLLLRTLEDSADVFGRRDILAVSAEPLRPTMTWQVGEIGAFLSRRSNYRRG